MEVTEVTFLIIGILGALALISAVVILGFALMIHAIETIARYENSRNGGKSK